jgi:hypothetical protein
MTGILSEGLVSFGLKSNSKTINLFKNFKKYVSTFESDVNQINCTPLFHGVKNHVIRVAEKATLFNNSKISLSEAIKNIVFLDTDKIAS